MIICLINANERMSRGLCQTSPQYTASYIVNKYTSIQFSLLLTAIKKICLLLTAILFIVNGYPEDMFIVNGYPEDMFINRERRV